MNENLEVTLATGLEGTQNGGHEVDQGESLLKFLFNLLQ